MCRTISQQGINSRIADELLRQVRRDSRLAFQSGDKIVLHSYEISRTRPNPCRLYDPVDGSVIVFITWSTPLQQPTHFPVEIVAAERGRRPLSAVTASIQKVTKK
ncbi:hypothetical protein DAPPUDRAFT_238882 [Daphnia pulex]|uniref:Uncharacterized protein n=1 Tax=Daphnia pulex TaxID=6669 RepID=E9G7P0_DAPPU|nr:hypothetical protein DAPPUDRAFT_238882 [Daphnia pulex]|eukprot:EFX84509.1 hypothetical protein DAPPUDRAFT_238882 [Daphnia pulex]